MSTDFVSLETIKFADLFDGRMKRFGVREHIKPEKYYGRLPPPDRRP